MYGILINQSKALKDEKLKKIEVKREANIITPDNKLALGRHVRYCA